MQKTIFLSTMIVAPAPDAEWRERAGLFCLFQARLPQAQGQYDSLLRIPDDSSGPSSGYPDVGE